MTIKLKLSTLLTSCALTASLSLPLAPQAQADDSFILAQAMNTDHIFHAASEQFIGHLEKPGLYVAERAELTARLQF